MNYNLFKELINKGVDITQYLLLQYLNCNVDIKEISENTKIIGRLFVLQKHKLIDKLGDIWVVTDKGKQILGTEVREIQVVQQIDWVKELYDNIEEIIFKNTGKKQYLNGSGKYLKPANVQILRDRFSTFFKKFGNQDVEKIKKAILNYTNKVSKGEIKYAVTLLYFIFKEGKLGGNYESQLLEWMEVEVEQEQEQENKCETIINTKSLF